MEAETAAGKGRVHPVSRHKQTAQGDEIGGSPSLPCPIPSHARMGIGRVANKNTVRALKIGPGQQTNSQKADRVVRPGHKTTLLSLRGSLPRARANSPLICASGARRRPRSAWANGCQPDRFTPGPPARCTKAAWGSAKRARGPAGQPAPAGSAADRSSEAGPRRHEHPAAVLLERWDVGAGSSAASRTAAYHSIAYTLMRNTG